MFVLAQSRYEAEVEVEIGHVAGVSNTGKASASPSLSASSVILAAPAATPKAVLD